MPPRARSRENHEDQGELPEGQERTTVMLTSHEDSRAPEWFILAGGLFFVLVLAISAYWEADIRWLHCFQAWMYIAAIVFSFRGSRWGYFIGISAAGLWDYTKVFRHNLPL
jgi:hypothetical protein